MAIITLEAKEFKKMEDPVDIRNGHVKYVCYVRASSIPDTIDDWMETNPREQKMTTNVANGIKESLVENASFHELNRGILMSAEGAKWNNATGELCLVFSNPEIHGNIDGGHTLRAILDASTNNRLPDERYVFMEIIVGLDSPVELAAARNSSVQVDLKSIEELQKSFDALKEVFEPLSFSNRIQYKQNEHYSDSEINPIDIRELISIILMFSQEIYPKKDEFNKLTEVQPIQCYSGKEASLKKFLKCEGGSNKNQKLSRDRMVRNMAPIVKDVFDIWEIIETTFANQSSQANKRYGAKKYSKYDGGAEVGESFFGEKPLTHIVPKGLMFPVVGAFRALVEKGEDGLYSWKKDPRIVWKELGPKLVSILLEEKAETPDAIAKNSNLWSNLFKEVYIYAYLE